MGFRIQPMMRLRHCGYGVGHLHTLVKVDVPVTPFTASYQDFPDQTANNQRICGSSPSCGSGVCTATATGFVAIVRIQTEASLSDLSLSWENCRDSIGAAISQNLGT